ncbi:MAG: zinc metalloprotease, partial [Bacteroidota bacterium]
TALSQPTTPFCGTADPSPQQILEQRSSFNYWIASGNNSVQTVADYVYIPVAFHVVRKDDGSNGVTNEQIQSQIAILNENFAGSPFRFFLHSIDISNNTYWSTQIRTDPPAAVEIEMKNALAIDVTHVMNFYTVSSIDGFSGYARLPETLLETSKLHGVVLDYRAMPGGSLPNYNLGKLGVHEVGHYLGLYHTFANNCDSTGDAVDDTPYQAYGFWVFDCDDFDSCPGGGVYEGLDPVHNHMNYSDDNCRIEFTSGQFARMNQQMAQHRPSIYGTIVSINQTKENGSTFAGTSVGRWEGMSFKNYFVPFSFQQLSGTPFVLRGNQDLHSGEKYNQWNDLPDVINHRTFIVGTVTEAVSRFRGAHQATLETSINGNSAGNVVQFKDPWLVDDYTDPMGQRNRDTNAVFYLVPSGTYNIGLETNYQGVFLNQSGPPNFPPPYYSVKVPLITTINGSTAFFAGWSYDPAYISLGQPEPSPSGYDQKAVVFKQAGATLTAQYSHSTISLNTTLPAGTYPIAGSLTVSSGVTLTLSPGTTLEFPTGATLTGSGKITADGTSGQKVIFTRRSGSNDWQGISLSGSGANGSLLRHCTISYAKQPVVVNWVSSLTINLSTINNSSFYDENFDDAAALRFYHSSPTIEFVTIKGQSNSWNGV